jgi:hypothetical protein
MALLTEGGFIRYTPDASPENKHEWFPNEDERKRYDLTAYNAHILFYASAHLLSSFSVNRNG